MPNNVINSIVDEQPKKNKKKVRNVLEDKWDKAESIAKEQGFKKNSDEFYPYVMGIFKKMNPDNFNEMLDIINEGRKKKKRKGVTADVKTWDRWTYPAYQLHFDRDQTSNLPDIGGDGGDMAMGESRKDPQEGLIHLTNYLLD